VGLCKLARTDATIASVRAAGGLTAIASSHPHFYGALMEWSRAFDAIPIYLHAADKAWVMRPDPTMVFWEGATYPLAPGLTLIHCGGHFAGRSGAPSHHFACSWTNTLGTFPVS
jgi:glyoxylase-like metal-dependent hydrolase (beta-lactamase superfamily II)